MENTKKILKQQLLELQHIKMCLSCINTNNKEEEKKKFLNSIDSLIEFVKSHIQDDFIKAYKMLPKVKEAVKLINDNDCTNIFLEQEKLVIQKYKEITN